MANLCENVCNSGFSERWFVGWIKKAEDLVDKSILQDDSPTRQGESSQKNETQSNDQSSIFDELAQKFQGAEKDAELTKQVEVLPQATLEKLLVEGTSKNRKNLCR